MSAFSAASLSELAHLPAPTPQLFKLFTEILSGPPPLAWWRQLASWAGTLNTPALALEIAQTLQQLVPTGSPALRERHPLYATLQTLCLQLLAHRLQAGATDRALGLLNSLQAPEAQQEAHLRLAQHFMAHNNPELASFMLERLSYYPLRQRVIECWLAQLHGHPQEQPLAILDLLIQAGQPEVALECLIDMLDHTDLLEYPEHLAHYHDCWAHLIEARPLLAELAEWVQAQGPDFRNRCCTLLLSRPQPFDNRVFDFRQRTLSLGLEALFISLLELPNSAQELLDKLTRRITMPEPHPEFDALEQCIQTFFTSLIALALGSQQQAEQLLTESHQIARLMPWYIQQDLKGRPDLDYRTLLLVNIALAWRQLGQTKRMRTALTDAYQAACETLDVSLHCLHRALDHVLQHTQQAGEWICALVLLEQVATNPFLAHQIPLSRYLEDFFQGVVQQSPTLRQEVLGPLAQLIQILPLPQREQLRWLLRCAQAHPDNTTAQALVKTFQQHIAPLPVFLRQEAELLEIPWLLHQNQITAALERAELLVAERSAAYVHEIEQISTWLLGVDRQREAWQWLERLPSEQRWSVLKHWLRQGGMPDAVHYLPVLNACLTAQSPWATALLQQPEGLSHVALFLQGADLETRQTWITQILPWAPPWHNTPAQQKLLTVWPLTAHLAWEGALYVLQTLFNVGGEAQALSYWTTVLAPVILQES
jgi:hypothetical protein